ncbi:MAG: hypothetical protein IPJ88_11490 [Myxococcales bacterium]|nr:MAG: hypothetical protein IPJ88_11490 [Myxococcales bacterium]
MAILSVVHAKKGRLAELAEIRPLTDRNGVKLALNMTVLACLVFSLSCRDRHPRFLDEFDVDSGADAQVDSGPECVGNAGCMNAEASRCELDGGVCTECINDLDCVHLSALPYCESGQCVECRIATEASDCGGTFCSEEDFSCTQVSTGSKDVCESCTADNQCSAGRRCVSFTFDSTPVGSFCFLHASLGCGDTVTAHRPYRSKVSATSVDGEIGDYCFPPTSTTCKGISDTQSLSCASNTSCGESLLDDGYCPSAGSGAGFCSYECGGNLDCAPTLNCAGTPLHCRP